MAIVINIDKAKEIAHDMRRVKRSEEFVPLDLKVTIPSEATAAEAARQSVREKYATIQNNIDSASDVTELKTIVEAL